MFDNYDFDSRVVAGRKNDWFESIDPNKMKAIVIMEDDEGNEIKKEVSFKYEVCPTCNGRGSHVNPSIDCNGLSQEDFAADPDFASNYFSGNYDVNCYDCNGRNVVPLCADEEVSEYLRKEAEYDAEYNAICAMEQRMGC